jgi:Ca-activated chloride channel family protein
MSLVLRHRRFATVLYGAALVLVSLAIAGVRGCDDASSRAPVLVLLDRSLSMPRPAVDDALERLRRAVAPRPVEALEFAGGVGTDLQPTATNLERAIDRALVEQARRPLAAIVVVSDGRANAGDTEGAVRAAHEAGATLHWVGVSRTRPSAWIEEVHAPSTVPRGSDVPVDIRLAGDLQRELRLRVTTTTPSGTQRTSTSAVRGPPRVAVTIKAPREGPLEVGVGLTDADTGAVVDARQHAALVELVEPARVLYLHGGVPTLARSLQTGGWPVDLQPPARGDVHADRLAGFDAIVLDDVAATDLSRGFTQALSRAVERDGVGLLVLGGERAFGRGAYRGSALEGLLPVLSEPARLERPTHVTFVVDKSGSMGTDDSGVNRLGYAQRAVADAVAALAPDDTFGVVVFDVEAQVLVPPTPVARADDRLGGRWPIEAHGGTELAPALDLALAQLRAIDARRVLVLVTDGFVATDASLAALRQEVLKLGIECVAVGLGEEADLGALAAVAGQDAVVRVGEPAQLPVALRQAVSARRVRIERGPMPVTTRDLPPWIAEPSGGWPPVEAYAVTRLRAGASEWLQSARGDPVLAAWTLGAGRVAALTSGVGPWTPAWLGSPAWPAFAAGLLGWLVGQPGTSSALHAVEDGAGLLVELQQRASSSSLPAPTLRFVTPSGRAGEALFAAYAPDRWRVRLPDAQPGVYTLVAATSDGSERRLHLHGEGVEREGWGVDPRVARWQHEGLVRPWREADAHAVLGPSAAARAPSRTLVAIALLVLLAAITIERAAGNLRVPRRVVNLSRALRAGGRSWRPPVVRILRRTARSG